MGHLERTAAGIDVQPWNYTNGVIPGGEPRGTNPRSERINRENAQIYAREEAKRREEAEWMAGKPDRDRSEALRTPAVRIGEMNEPLTEAKSLHEVCVEGLWRLTGSQII
jgi:hypothetical protein